jgi:hypothetical protein
LTTIGRVRVVDVDLDAFPAALEGLDGYAAVQALVRLHGAPMGVVRLPVQGGRCSGAALREAVLRELWSPVVRHLLADALAGPPIDGGLDVEAVVAAPHPTRCGRQPTVTVAVCTRDRTADLARSSSPTPTTTWWSIRSGSPPSPPSSPRIPR